MRVHFSDVFQSNDDGSYTPKTGVYLGGVTRGPGDVFRRGEPVSGFDIAAVAGRDLEVERRSDGSVEIKDHYR